MIKQIKKQDEIRCRLWEDPELGKLYYLRRNGVPYKLIGAELNRTEESCKKKYNSTVWSKTRFYNEALDNTIPKQEKAAYLESFTRSQDRKMKVHQMAADIVADRMEQAIESLPAVPKSIYKPRSIVRSKTNNEEDVGLILSDLHIGHEHSLEETGGISEYNQNVIEERIENLKLATRDIFELHSKLYRLPNLRIFCLGDIVAGMNAVGSWSNTFINLSIYDQVAKGCEMLAGMIYYWLGMFDEITFYGVRGNHGKAAPLGIEKDYVNWDLICYDYLKNRFANNPRVKFVTPKTWWILAEIKKHNFLIVHGDDIKSGTYPAKALHDFGLKMAPIIGKNPDYTIAGHFHSSSEFTTNSGRVIINGSFVGGDVYSMKELHSSCKPEQKIFGIHETHGITWTYNINLKAKRN